MNMLNSLQALLNPEIKGVARIVGQKGGGTVVGETLGGGTVVLQGQAENGKMVYYDKLTMRVLSEAPDAAERGEFGV